jgi:hypothetical protein
VEKNATEKSTVLFNKRKSLKASGIYKVASFNIAPEKQVPML